MAHALKNKWSNGLANFDFSQIDRQILSYEGIMPIPSVIDPLVGSEMVLLLIDHTPFIYELAKTRPFRLLLKTGLVKTSHGPVMFLLFTIPNPLPGQPPLLHIDAHANPFDIQHMTVWRDLSRQSHWHLFLVDAKQAQAGFFELENTYNLDATLSKVMKVCQGMPQGNFWLAKAEFCEKYSLEDLASM